jgi:tRNA-dihydrouridine synthase B
VSTPHYYLAPIRGVTDQTYRNLYGEFFPVFDGAVAPFIASARGGKIRPNHFSDLIPSRETGIPTVPQLLTCSADDFVATAEHLFAMGHSSVNWNLGCPFPVVIKKTSGAGLLARPDLVEKILDHVAPRLSGSLSIKMRLGLTSREESLRLLPILDNYPIEEIIIHPRTGRQMYDGKVDLQAFADCLGATKHEVVYNGDIDSLETLEQLQSRFGSVHKWMIGRWALRDPWAVMGIRALSPEESSRKFTVLAEFHDALFEAYRTKMSGPGHLLDRMKAIWSYLAHSFDGTPKILKRIRKVKSVAHYNDVVADILHRA